MTDETRVTQTFKYWYSTSAGTVQVQVQYKYRTVQCNVQVLIYTSVRTKYILWRLYGIFYNHHHIRQAISSIAASSNKNIVGESGSSEEKLNATWLQMVKVSSMMITMIMI